ncbi:hypothetical protein CLAFUW4_20044 [Fulvia fulva]|uniref:uncharacterized protein n=1 Tax=Passalora fulva TaxID=5499 RepID=UPI002852872E|nr:uncharacterized protein CLAFUR5_20044 [Fulvia fulva]KAK4624648.1 hypothetical protein CLAFUR4_20044 [Fulvia fulva]KAK4625313.1 hypothetical protein CLAFUR0_20044 [Fulvia fulva]WMI38890.1 hypothetical protein CLAFUR5_20044 [Fulvia fulva]WPV14533.1 hypothetical protein CLAFUW4_20044 [Fulvia fulva]WPV30569.1 hypothetical protein CLAFUW7_20044 [Fulvia fulva]
MRPLNLFLLTVFTCVVSGAPQAATTCAITRARPRCDCVLPVSTTTSERDCGACTLRNHPIRCTIPCLQPLTTDDSYTTTATICATSAPTPTPY